MPFQEIDEQGNPVVDEEGKGNVIDNPGSWDLVKGMIPEELRDEKLWEHIQDTPTLLKNYAHAQKLQGQSVRIPGEDATPEDLAKFYGQLGRPEGIDGYEVTLPDVRGGWDDHMVEGFKKTSHELGLTPKQVQGILNFYGPSVDAILASGERDHHNEQVAATEALKEKYGIAYPQKIAVAKAALEHYADERLVDKLTDSGMLNDTGFIEMFAGIGEFLQEDEHITGYVEGATTMESAKEELEKIRADLDGPYWKANHPDHDKKVERVRKLTQMIYPEPIRRD